MPRPQNKSYIDYNVKLQRAENKIKNLREYKSNAAKCEKQKIEQQICDAEKTLKKCEKIIRNGTQPHSKYIVINARQNNWPQNIHLASSDSENSERVNNEQPTILRLSNENTITPTNDMVRAFNFG